MARRSLYEDPLRPRPRRFVNDVAAVNHMAMRAPRIDPGRGHASGHGPGRPRPRLNRPSNDSRLARGHMAASVGPNVAALGPRACPVGALACGL